MARKRRLPKVEDHYGAKRIRVMIDGERVSRVFPTEAEAQRWAMMVIDGGASELRSFQDGIDLVMKEIVASRVRRGSMRYYGDQIKQVTKGIRADSLLVEIDTDRLREFIALRNEQVSAGTVAKNLAFLRRIFRRAQAEGWIRDDPTVRLAPLQAQIGKRHRPKRHPALPAAQIDSIIESIRNAPKKYYAAPRDADAILVFWATGLRRQEAADVRIKDVDQWTGRVVVDPKRRGTIVFAEGPGREALRRLCKDRDPEERLIGTEGAISHLFTRWRKRLNNPAIKAHSVRHGVATHLVQQGAQLLDVKEIMRHSTVAMTAQYFHPDDDDLRATSSLLHRRTDRHTPEQRDASHGGE